MIAQKSRKRASFYFSISFYLVCSSGCSTNGLPYFVKEFHYILLYHTITSFGIFYFENHQSEFPEQRQSLNESRYIVFSKSNTISFNCDVDLSYHSGKNAYGHCYDFWSAFNALQLVILI